MNLRDMRQALLDDVMNGIDVGEPALNNAFQYTHRRVQLDLNWRCMEARLAALAYPAADQDGVVVESADDAADCKTIRQVWLSGDGGALTDVDPANEDQVIQARRALSATPTAAAVRSVWYEARQRLVIYPTPGTALTFTVDYYRLLPFYLDVTGKLDPSQSDWFSNNIPETLQFGAAYFLSKNVLEDSRAESFKMQFLELLASAHASDKKSKQGAVGRVYSPALPGNGRPWGC